MWGLAKWLSLSIKPHIDEWTSRDVPKKTGFAKCMDHTIHLQIDPRCLSGRNTVKTVPFWDISYQILSCQESLNDLDIES